MRNYMGLDGFIWFTGVVEDRNDPSKLGRVRVRCVGHHTDDKTKIPTTDLPWAHVMHPVTDPSMNGMGNTPTFMVEGTWVVGFFMDADDKQQPIIIGTLPGVPDEKPNTAKGFYDPNGVYPKTDFLNESDVNRLARGETENTIVETKKSKKLEGILIADGEEWDEPDTTYNAEYPKNHVFESESGHIVELDDTSGAERLHEYSSSGTFYEIDKDGNKHEKIVSNSYRVTEIDDFNFVRGDMTLTVNGTLNIKCKNFNIEVTEDYIDEIEGDRKTFVEGDVELHTQTKFDIFAKNTVNIDTASLDVDATTVITLTSDITTINGVTSTNVRGATVNLEGTTSNIVGTTVSIDGTTLDIDGTTTTLDASSLTVNSTESNLKSLDTALGTNLGVIIHGVSPSVSISDITSPGTVSVTDPTKPVILESEPTSSGVGYDQETPPRGTDQNGDSASNGPVRTDGGPMAGSNSSGKDVKLPTADQPPGDCKRESLGDVSALWESNQDPGRLNDDTYLTDKGGWSYGTYQIETKGGTFRDFMNWMNNRQEYKSYYNQLQKVGGVSAATRGTKEFQNKFRELAYDNPDSANSFAKAQKGFVQSEKYDKAVNFIKNDFPEIDICGGLHSDGLQDAIWSTSIQHGEGGARKVFRRAYKRLLEENNNDKTKITDEMLINEIYDERSDLPEYFPSFLKSNPVAANNMVTDRFADERRRALALNSNSLYNLGIIESI